MRDVRTAVLVKIIQEIRKLLSLPFNS